MQIVIDIPDELHNDIKTHPLFSSDIPAIERAIKKGTPLPNTLEYLEAAYTGARACDDVAEQVRLARAIEAYKQDVYEKCTVLDKIRAEMENLWKLKKSQGSPFYFGLGVALDIIDKYMAESEDK